MKKNFQNQEFTKMKITTSFLIKFADDFKLNISSLVHESDTDENLLESPTIIRLYSRKLELDTRFDQIKN